MVLSYLKVYYTALLRAVERSRLFHGPSRLPAVNYFSIMKVAKHIMAAVKARGSDSRLSYHSASSLVTYQPDWVWVFIT